MDEYETEDLVDVMLIKNNLILLDSDTLIEKCNSKKTFKFFIDSINKLLDTESSFLLLDEAYIDKIQEVVNMYRFSFRDKEYVSILNGVICKINEVKNYPDSLVEAMKDSYIETQSELRKFSFPSLETFMMSLSYDAVCILAFREQSEELITEETLFYCSSNYFINTIPEIYDDEYTNNLTDKIINKRLSRFSFLERNVKAFAKDTKESIEKIKKR